MPAHHPQQSGQHAGEQAYAGIQDDVKHGIIARPYCQQHAADQHVRNKQRRHGMKDRRLLALDSLIGG